MPEAWLAALAGSGLATLDMAADLAALLGPKDDEEVKNVKKAAYLVANALTKFAVPQLEGKEGGVGAVGRGKGRLEQWPPVGRQPGEGGPGRRCWLVHEGGHARSAVVRRLVGCASREALGMGMPAAG